MIDISGCMPGSWTVKHNGANGAQACVRQFRHVNVNVNVNNLLARHDMYLCVITTNRCECNVLLQRLQ